jgi:hypothetical protein
MRASAHRSNQPLERLGSAARPRPLNADVGCGHSRWPAQMAMLVATLFALGSLECRQASTIGDLRGPIWIQSADILLDGGSFVATICDLTGRSLALSIDRRIGTSTPNAVHVRGLQPQSPARIIEPGSVEERRLRRAMSHWLAWRYSRARLREFRELLKTRPADVPMRARFALAICGDRYV